MRRIQELDGLRFLAIVSVMAVHYRPPFRSDVEVLAYGWVGVDLFFVLSGFLITSNLLALRDASNPFRVFYWRRTLRIFPPYYLVLLPMVVFLVHEREITRQFATVSILFLTSLLSVHPQMLLHQVMTSGFHLSYARTLIDNHLFTQYPQGLGVFWSLSVEELFYILWAPVILKLPKRYALLVSLLLLGVSPILRAIAHTPSWEEYYYFPMRLDGLLMGSVLALAFAASKVGVVALSTLRYGLWWLASGSALALLALCVYDGALMHVEIRSALSFAVAGYSLMAAFFTALVGLTVVAADQDVWIVRLLRSRPLVFIGSISYMMYLVHIAVWVTVYKVLARIGGHDFIPGLGMGLLAAVCTVAFSTLSRAYFEQPILRFKDAAFALPLRVQARTTAMLHVQTTKHSGMDGAAG